MGKKIKRNNGQVMCTKRKWEQRKLDYKSNDIQWYISRQRTEKCIGMVGFSTDNNDVYENIYEMLVILVIIGLI